MDKEHGGVYTCLTRDGKVFSTDKSVWMQGRCAWTFSYLCRVYGKKQEWLDAAKSCLDFLEEHCIKMCIRDSYKAVAQELPIMLMTALGKRPVPLNVIEETVNTVPGLIAIKDDILSLIHI